VARQGELLALHSYVLAATQALAEAEKRLLTALGQATTVGDNERAAEVRDLLGEDVARLREATAGLAEWLGGSAVNQ